MKTILLSAALILAVTFVGCDKEDIPALNDLPAKTKQLLDADNEFGMELFRRVNSGLKDDENMAVSPLSVSLALAMTYNGAAGDTRIAMEETLKLAGLSRDEINQLYRDLVMALLSDDPEVKLEIANSIWYRDDYEILAEFIERNEVYYDAMVEALDFSDPGAKDIINSWVADKTHDKIDSIVDQISAQSFMFLINAIYFKGTWKYQFEEKDTEERVFNLENGNSIQVPTMKIEADLNMMKSDLFNAVELPYGNGNWVMYILVPNDDYKVNDVIAGLDNSSWKDYQADFYEQKEVKLQLPKWKSEFEASLKPVLTDMGMGVSFTDAADFSDILPGAPLTISDVKHKTFIEVNEEGTEAAAVTSVVIELTSITGEYFFVDKPFVYIISEKTTGAILFAGRVMNPLN